jgi:hypothetical protein
MRGLRKGADRNGDQRAHLSDDAAGIALRPTGTDTFSTHFRFRQETLSRQCRRSMPARYFDCWYASIRYREEAARRALGYLIAARRHPHQWRPQARPELARERQGPLDIENATPSRYRFGVGSFDDRFEELEDAV